MCFRVYGGKFKVRFWVVCLGSFLRAESILFVVSVVEIRVGRNKDLSRGISSISSIIKIRC